MQINSVWYHTFKGVTSQIKIDQVKGMGVKATVIAPEHQSGKVIRCLAKHLTRHEPSNVYSILDMSEAEALQHLKNQKL